VGLGSGWGRVLRDGERGAERDFSVLEGRVGQREDERGTRGDSEGETVETGNR